MEFDQLIEIAHILAGPVLAIVITAMAFMDEAIIISRVKKLFEAMNTPQDLSEAIEDLIAGAVALATFLGNVYLFVFNAIIAVIVFPHPDLRIVSTISLIAAICIIIQAIYIFRKYGADIGEFCPLPRITEMRYPEFLRWEQVILNILTAIYFAIGIYLKLDPVPFKWHGD